MLVISMLRMVGTASPITSLGMGVWVILMNCAFWAFSCWDIMLHAPCTCFLQ